MNAVAETKSLPLPAPSQESERLPCREHSTWSVGDCAHQGDLIFVCIAKMPKGKRRENRQLAEGETRGSRHVLSGGEVFDTDAEAVAKTINAATGGNVAAKYIGPVFTGPATVEHPEHQHQSFPADTVTVCVFQRNQTAEEREVRARD